MKVLFVSDFILLGHSGGAHLSLAHLNTLRKIYGAENIISIAVTYAQNVTSKDYECYKSYSSKLGQLFNIIQGNPHALNDRINKRILEIIEEYNIQMVFLDNGYFGKTCKLIKQIHPGILLVSFNHGILRNKTNQQINERRKKIIYWPQIYGLLRGEKQTSKIADVNIVLNYRDAQEFENAYGRKADIILPAYIEEMNNIDRKIVISHDARILFVGGNFYPNVYGIKWFVENVLDKLIGDVSLTIVGRGLEFLKEDSLLKDNSRILVVGGVDDLSDWYNKANVVIGPIFQGDGMKTKTAEALQFGKMYVGTREALCGYDTLKDYECNSKEEFIAFINSQIKNGIPSYIPEIRDIFDKYYSTRSAVRILSNLNEYMSI